MLGFIHHAQEYFTLGKQSCPRLYKVTRVWFPLLGENEVSYQDMVTISSHCSDAQGNTLK